MSGFEEQYGEIDRDLEEAMALQGRKHTESLLDRARKQGKLLDTPTGIKAYITNQLQPLIERIEKLEDINLGIDITISEERKVDLRAYKKEQQRLDAELAETVKEEGNS